MQQQLLWETADNEISVQKCDVYLATALKKVNNRSIFYIPCCCCCYTYVWWDLFGSNAYVYLYVINDSPKFILSSRKLVALLSCLIIYNKRNVNPLLYTISFVTIIINRTVIYTSYIMHLCYC